MRQVFVTGEQDAETLKRQVIYLTELKTYDWLQSKQIRSLSIQKFNWFDWLTFVWRFYIYLYIYISVYILRI